jgi:PhnB protein
LSLVRPDDSLVVDPCAMTEGTAMANVKKIPEGYPQISPYLCVDGAAAAIDFYREVFGATERMRMAAPDGKVGHAELQIGSGVVMLADEYPEMDIVGPGRVGGTPVTVSVYVEDVDAVFDRAVKAGARVLRPVENQFYGDRSGQFLDPFGHRWSVATHVEDVSPQEMAARAAKLAPGG